MSHIPKLSDEDIELLVQSLKLDLENTRQFLNSDLCKCMCNDIVTRNASINTEYFAYYPDRLKNDLGWHDKSNDDINLFFNAMASTDGIEPDSDCECPFENYTFERHGVIINILSGQGTIVSVQSPHYKTEST